MTAAEALESNTLFIDVVGSGLPEVDGLWQSVEELLRRRERDRIRQGKEL